MEDFHVLLVFGRLVSLSNGRPCLDPLDWEEAKRKEKERKERATTLPARGGAKTCMESTLMHCEASGGLGLLR